MTLFQQPIYAPNAAGGLCRKCTWGTVHVGFFRGETQTVCRLMGPAFACTICRARLH